MDQDEKEAMILIDAIMDMQETIKIDHANVEQLLRENEKLLAMIETLYKEQHNMQREIARLRMNQANGWTI